MLSYYVNSQFPACKKRWSKKASWRAEDLVNNLTPEEGESWMSLYLKTKCQTGKDSSTTLTFVERT